MSNKKSIITFLCILLVFLGESSAQAGSDFMRSTGKIYVVVGVILAIFIGIIAYLFSLDRKLTKLENQIDQHD